MTKYKVVVHSERILDANDETDALERFWEDIDMMFDGGFDEFMQEATSVEEIKVTKK